METNNITIVEETNSELEKLKGKWEIEGAVSGTFEVPENILVTQKPNFFKLLYVSKYFIYVV